MQIGIWKNCSQVKSCEVKSCAKNYAMKIFSLVFSLFFRITKVTPFRQKVLAKSYPQKGNRTCKIKINSEIELVRSTE